MLAIEKKSEKSVHIEKKKSAQVGQKNLGRLWRLSTYDPFHLFSRRDGRTDGMGVFTSENFELSQNEFSKSRALFQKVSRVLNRQSRPNFFWPTWADFFFFNMNRFFRFFFNGQQMADFFFFHERVFSD